MLHVGTSGQRGRVVVRKLRALAILGVLRFTVVEQFYAPTESTIMREMIEWSKIGRSRLRRPGTYQNSGRRC